MTGSKPTTVPEYIEAAPPQARKHLRELRALLREIAPGATEALKGERCALDVLRDGGHTEAGAGETGRIEDREGHHMSKRTSVGVILLAAAAVVACNGFGPRVCTQIGCESGLTVELQGTAAGTFTVTATAASGESQSVTCSEGSQCRLFFLDLISSRVTITYESEGQILEQTFSPEYRRTRPNGQDCPPECLNATIVLDVEP